ncbi:MAG: PKD domain-containing protein, partial [Verrucomicrobia bacterium]|nr:PKD domain-containing protein [Verrucomicrobiota bacterium]
MKLVRVLSGLFALATCSCLGRTLYVSPVGSQTLPFTSWATAAREIQMAARFALDGDIIVVTNGTYKPFIVLTRAAQLVSVNGPEHTIIDGVIDRLQGGRCLEVTGGGLVKGFTVRRGNSPEDGGGIWIGEGTIESCVIEDNVSGAKGGGVYCEDDAVVLNCVIRRNQAASSGGGVAMAWGGHLRNCLIVDNQSLGDSGGGVACEWDGAIWNCTITRNRAELTGGGLRFETDGWVVNSIVYGNEAGRSHSNVDGSEVLFECCCSVPKPEGENNLSADPAFLAPEEGDCRLAVSSPCVDAGRNEPRMQGETDLEGLPRIQNRAVDLGAYEAGALRCGFRVTPKEGEQPLLDVAFDAYVTGTNLVGLQYAWDLDGDGQFETAEGPAATYSFSAAGTFSPLLMVRNAAGEEASLRRRDCIRVVAPLVADFIAAPLLGSAPMTVRFTDQSRGSPTNWAWDFDHDDIIDSTAQNPSHTYQSPGQYTVTLTVRRRPGTAEESVASLTRRDYVHLPGYALEAAFRAELDTARIGEPVQFRDETRHATGGERWAWDFDGDGQSDSAERHPLHTFGSAGSKIVELVVSNTYSLSRTSRLALVVFGLTRSHYVSLQGGHVAPFVTWATAATNVQAAIDAAEAADTVVFAPGVYGLSRPLEVTHEMTLISAEGPLRTVLDGGGTTTCLRLRNRFAAVEGLTIRNGASSADGGGVDLLGTMRHCRVVACRATRGGGVRAGPGAALLDCVIEGNEAATGGGVYFESNSTLERCILRGNVAAEDGGGVYGVGGRLRNLLIVENWARRGTGADLALSSVESCTIVRNLSQDSLTEGLRCGWDLKAINSIIYHNAGQNLYAGGGLFEHCCLLPDPGGLGNITAPPKLVPGGYQLSWASPCRDVGTNQTWMTDAVDLAQAPRLQNGVTDLGCQELGHFVCGFDLSPRTGTIPLLARIEGGAGATNALPVHYFWDLDGDGRYDRDGLNMTTLTHEYANEGTYTVALLASNTVGELAYFIRTNVLVAYASRVRYVSAEGSHTPPFTSWPTAATNLQAALDVARDADQVLLTNGLYRSGAPVVVNKAVRVSSVHGALTAILDGEGAYRCIVLAHTNAVVEGLTLTGGMAEDGGGGYVRQGLVRLCRVMGNVATRYGGGLHVEGNSTVRGCLLADNQAAWGGGLSLAGEPKIEAVTIAGNRARSGGGLVVQQWGKPQLINSIIY